MASLFSPDHIRLKRGLSSTHLRFEASSSADTLFDRPENSCVHRFFASHIRYRIILPAGQDSEGGGIFIYWGEEGFESTLFSIHTLNIFVAKFRSFLILDLFHVKLLDLFTSSPNASPIRNR